MHRSKSGSNWIVHKLIERDQINHHYRRLNTAQSQLQLNKRTLVASRNRLSKSSNDLRFEDQLRGVEDKFVNEFYLDVTPLVSDKRKEISDHSQDVMSRHSQYFTHPSKQFTPRTVRKIVRPQTTPPKRVSSAVVRPVTPVVSVRSNSAVPTPRKIQNRAVKAIAADPKRNVSDDSAFGDEHSTVESDSSNSSSDSLGTAEFNIKTWLKEQEEENRYMQLMCDVTADLLQRSLCTNGGMKEIIHTYIRQSKKKFEVSSNVLMKRLCEDLMIPLDSSFDDQYYGSRYSSIAHRQQVQPHKMSKNNYKEMNESDHFQSSSIQIAQYGGRRTSSLGSTKSSSPTLPKSNNCFEFEGTDEDNLLRPKSVDFTRKNDQKQVQFDPDCQFEPNKNQQKTELSKTAEGEGYFSDFTNDTENDIEEEFDFD